MGLITSSICSFGKKSGLKKKQPSSKRLILVFNKYIRSTYHVPSLLVDAGLIASRKKSCCSHGVHTVPVR
jgi:hypothetical protein